MQKTTKKARKTKAETRSIEVTKIRLTNKCKRELKALAKEYRDESKKESDKEKRKKIVSVAKMIIDAIWSIEQGRWFIPTKTYEYVDIVKDLEKNLPKFFNLPKKVKIEIGDLFTNILSFTKGHPKGVK